MILGQFSGHRIKSYKEFLMAHFYQNRTKIKGVYDIEDIRY